MGLSAAVYLIAAIGCSHAVNPLKDDAVAAEEMATTSERLVRDADSSTVVRRREWRETTITHESGKVVHWPLWFEDPFEDKGSGDGKFAWTHEDYIAMPYSMARLVLNTMGWPVSAVLTPPGTPMASDGRLSRQMLGKDHDAIRLSRARQDTTTGHDEESESPHIAEGSDQPDEIVPNEQPEGPPPLAEQASHQQ